MYGLRRKSGNCFSWAESEEENQPDAFKMERPKRQVVTINPPL